jgi:iron complex outermembrane recepter protein
MTHDPNFCSVRSSAFAHRAFSAICLCLLFVVSPLFAAGPDVRSFDIPSGDAAVTLKLFVEQSGEQVVYLVDRVRGVTTKRIQGEMSARTALDAMLAGTELHAVADEKTKALVVHRGKRDATPPPADVPVSAVSPRSAESAGKVAAAASPEDNLIKLPTFSISSERDVSYVGKEALSTTRTGVELVDIPQSVIVLNQAFINDVNPTLLVKALSYVGGAQTGTINWSVDRYMIRGFVGEGDYVDGFRTQTDRNTDLNLIDHVEIIKGPSAIFIANQSATVGGVINKISKSPTPYHIANLTVQAGRWDANRADLDLSGPITADKKLMYRLLIAGMDAEGYYDSTYEKRTSIVPMLRYQFSRDTDVWLKFETFSSHYSSYNGIPLDGRTNAIVAVPYTRNFSEDTPLNWRTDKFWRLWGQFSTRLNEHVAMRLAAFDSVDRQRRVESIMAPTGGTVTNGVLTPQYVIPPSYVPGQLIPRGTTAIYPDYQPRRELQNDYVFNFNTGPAAHKLLIGANLVDYPQETKTYSSGGNSNAASSAIDPFSATRSPSVFVNFDQPPSNITKRTQSFAKVYALETASFLNNRVILSVGGSRNRFAFSQTSANYNQNTGVAATPVTVPEQRLYKNLLQYGIVIKPLPNVSVFYGYNKNFSSNGLSPSNVLMPPQEGEQKEFGVKSEWFGGKATFSVNYFDVVQLNNSVPAFPQTTPPSLVLVNGTESHGIDGDFSATLNKSFDLMGSFAFFDANVPLPAPWNSVLHPYDGKVHSRIPVNNASERNFSLWVRYKFPEHLVKGLSLGVGVNYLHKRAITDNNNQVLYSFLPARTLVDAAITYETPRARFQVNVDNVFDKHYIYAARSNQVIVPGAPLSLRASVTIKL